MTPSILFDPKTALPRVLESRGFQILRGVQTLRYRVGSEGKSEARCFAVIEHNGDGTERSSNSSYYDAAADEERGRESGLLEPPLSYSLRGDPP